MRHNQARVPEPGTSPGRPRALVGILGRQCSATERTSCVSFWRVGRFRVDQKGESVANTSFRESAASDRPTGGREPIGCFQTEVNTLDLVSKELCGLYARPWTGRSPGRCGNMRCQRVGARPAGLPVSLEQSACARAVCKGTGSSIAPKEERKSMAADIEAFIAQAKRLPRAWRLRLVAELSQDVLEEERHQDIEWASQRAKAGLSLEEQFARQGTLPWGGPRHPDLFPPQEVDEFLEWDHAQREESKSQ